MTSRFSDSTVYDTPMELKCPHCGSTDINLSMEITASGDFVPGGAQVSCKSCGREFALGGATAPQSDKAASAVKARKWWQFW